MRRWRRGEPGGGVPGRRGGSPATRPGRHRTQSSAATLSVPSGRRPSGSQGRRKTCPYTRGASMSLKGVRQKRTTKQSRVGQGMQSSYGHGMPCPYNAGDCFASRPLMAAMPGLNRRGLMNQALPRFDESNRYSFGAGARGNNSQCVRINPVMK